METDVKEGIKDLAKGFIRFSVKADDTEENRKIHEQFKEYCKQECDNNYTQGLKTLLDYVKQDVKMMAMYELFDSLSARLAVVEAAQVERKPVEEKKDDGGMF